jgi:hypothetical protein
MYSPPSNQQSEARVRQRDFMRMIGSWWHGLSDDMKAYYNSLGKAEFITGYDYFTHMMMIDLSLKPVAAVPSFFLPTPRIAPLPDLEQIDLWPPRTIAVYWTAPDVWCTDLVRFLAVELVEGGYSETLCEPEYWVLTVNEWIAAIVMPKADTTYLLFVIVQSEDGSCFGPAQWVVVTSGPDE